MATKVTQEALVAQGIKTAPVAQVTQEALVAQGIKTAPVAQVTQLAVVVFMRTSPDISWDETMAFDEIEFPVDIAYGAQGGPMYSDDVAVGGSGVDQRVSRWSHPLYEYDVSTGVQTMEQLRSLHAFFRARQGRLRCFRFKDWADFTSSTPTGQDYEAAITPTDQTIGTGDGVTTTFQLKKTYADSANPTERPITKPVQNTVRVAVDGVEKTEGVDFTVNYTTGVVTFTTAPGNGLEVTAGFEFDVPVRFDIERLPIRLESYGVAETQVRLVEVRKD